MKDTLFINKLILVSITNFECNAKTRKNVYYNLKRPTPEIEIYSPNSLMVNDNRGDIVQNPSTLCHLFVN